MNDQGFEPAITTLEQGGALVDTVNRLPLAQRTSTPISPARLATADPLLAYIKPPR